MIKAVLFDLDGTLYDRDVFIQALIEDQYTAFQAELPGISQTHFVTRFIELDDHGYGIKSHLYARVAEEWGLVPELSGRMLAHFWERYLERCLPCEDAAPTLQALRRNGKKLGVITNGPTKLQQQKLEALGIVDLFDTILISETEGVRKPDPIIFARAVERCGVSAHEAVYVGDHPDIDVAGALAAGLIPIWKFVPYWKLSSEGVLVVNGLREILPVCLQEP